MNALEIITFVFLVLSIALYVADSFAVFYRDLKVALEDKKLTQAELKVLEADARLIVRGFLRLIAKFRTL